ncbi:hypothetical protein OAN307_c22310 [Octadecabacter antarcticus 307]|uniref:Uncharacterized protein n=1 Tax=Octadecabacter antarcticus 307 TaxID=391626 RepID=M9RDF3_9RHOB|nr:hypothetical protein OAN307_c22310 [Octadecabacter antarcticus 307]
MCFSKPVKVWKIFKSSSLVADCTAQIPKINISIKSVGIFIMNTDSTIYECAEPQLSLTTDHLL